MQEGKGKNRTMILEWHFRHPTREEWRELQGKIDPERNWGSILQSFAELSSLAKRQKTFQGDVVCEFVDIRNDSSWASVARGRSGHAYFSYRFLYHFLGDGIPDDPTIDDEFRHFPNFGEGDEFAKTYDRKYGFDFYADCFFIQWAAATDSLCHVLNVLLGLRLSEGKVGFNRSQFLKGIHATLWDEERAELDQIHARRNDLVEFRNRIVHAKPLDFCGGGGFVEKSPHMFVLDMGVKDYVKSEDIARKVEECVEFLRDWVSFVVKVIRSHEEG